MTRARWVAARWAGLAACAASAFVAAVAFGSVAIHPRAFAAYLAGSGDPLVEVRVVRSALAFFVGAGLGASGAALQPVFRNPMADPYLLGGSAGAGLAVSALALAAPRLAGTQFAYPIAGFAGAVAAVGVTLALVGFGRRVPLTASLLTGVAVSFFCSALVPVFMVLSGRDLYAILFFLMGSVQGRPAGLVPIVGAVVVGGVVALAALGRAIDYLQLGEERARALGVDSRRRTLEVLVVAALVTGAAVAAGGIIGFVGLACPHFGRRVGGERAASSIVASALLGAGLLCVADLVSRVVIAPRELPIGVVTALLGAPFLARLVRRSLAEAGE